MLRRTLAVLVLTLATAAFTQQPSETVAPEHITIDAHAPATSLHGDQLTITVPPKGLALVEIH